MSEQNKALARKIYEGVNKGNVNAIFQLFDPKVVDHNPDPGQTGTDLAAMKESVASLKSGFPDMKVTIEELVAEKDTVVVRATHVGTHKGMFMGAAPTGKKITVHTLEMFHIKNGRVTDVWHHSDEMMALMQIGVKPPM